MRSVLVLPLMAAMAVRYIIMTSTCSGVISNRVELSTPLNSFKRAREGAFLKQNGIDPYSGDVVHEIPCLLALFSKVFKMNGEIIKLLYILMDVLTGLMLYRLSINIAKMKFEEQTHERKYYAPNTEDIWFHEDDERYISTSMLYIYLFNPFSILNCVSLTTSVLDNLLISTCLYFLSCENIGISLVFLALETTRCVYTFVLIAPIFLVSRRKAFLGRLSIVITFMLMCGLVFCFNYYLTNDFSFLSGTFDIIFSYSNLQPNIGLFWYFFTEMFDHFRTMFLITFQMNAAILYLLPLALKVYKEPHVLATVLLALISIFRAYPSIGDVSLYLALTPLWRRSWKYMAHNFIVFCFFVITCCLMPVLWYLWIYAGSANANFYFGATLAFSTGQIFLLTDLLFAHVKRQFCLFNGEKVYIRGKEAKILLE